LHDRNHEKKKIAERNTIQIVITAVRKLAYTQRRTESKEEKQEEGKRELTN